jgi:Protein of unknown function (DUF3237)
MNGLSSRFRRRCSRRSSAWRIDDPNQLAKRTIRSACAFALLTDDVETDVPSLEQVMTYRLRIRGPLASTRGSPRGERQYWEMLEGMLTGPNVNARIAMPGGDWFSLAPDGFGRPDVRVQLVTDDDAVILLHYTGLVQFTDAFTVAAEAGTPTRFEDQYMRMVMTFDTGAERYAWLNQSIFLAEGRLAGKQEIEYRIYRLT